MDEITTREAFGNTVLRIAERNDNVFAVVADTMKSMGLSSMYKKFPDRVIDVGIAEQNMMTIAAGIAAAGNLVFAGTYAVFACLRACEEIRNFVAYPRLNVKIAGGLAGLSGTYEGVTHQAVEDIGIMRSIPNMAVVVPADAGSTEAIIESLSTYPGPIYIRLGRYPVPKVFKNDYHFEFGKANVLKAEGSDATVICNGVMVSRVLAAEERLSAMGYGVRVIEMPTVKPIDSTSVLIAASETGAIVTVEEHSVIGGLGSAVAEVLSEGCPVFQTRIGLRDTFAESGEHEPLLDKYGLSVDRIVSDTSQLIARKLGIKVRQGT